MSKPIALITGASSGIGRATARTFLDGGYTTIVTARRVEALQETLDGHANGFAIPADMTKPDEVQALFAQIKKDHGRLDVTFNNAGAGVPGKSVEELSWEEWRHVMGVNIDGVFLSTKYAFELMRDKIRKVAASSTTALSPPMFPAPARPPTQPPSTLFKA